MAMFDILLTKTKFVKSVAEVLLSSQKLAHKRCG